MPPLPSPAATGVGLGLFTVKRLVEDLSKVVQEGRDLSSALARHPRIGVTRSWLTRSSCSG